MKYPERWKEIETECVSEIEFLCRLYREIDFKSWPEHKKTVDQQRGYPEPKIDIIPSPSKIKPRSYVQKETIKSMRNQENENSSSDDDESDDVEMTKLAKTLSSRAIKQIKHKPLITTKNNNMNVDHEDDDDEEKQKEKENAEDHDDDEEESNGKNNIYIGGDAFISVDVDKIDFSMDPKKVARDSLVMYLNLCKLWSEAVTRHQENLWLGEELYNDPILIAFICNKCPLLQYLCITLKKLFCSSNNNMPCERAFKYPKFAVGMYSHKYKLGTVIDLQNINEMQLNEEMQSKIEDHFDETPLFISKLMEVINMPDKFSKCQGLQDLYKEAIKRTKELQQQNPYWS